jgi:hypothetical protein
MPALNLNGSIRGLNDVRIPEPEYEKNGNEDGFETVKAIEYERNKRVTLEKAERQALAPTVGWHEPECAAIPQV